MSKSGDGEGGYRQGVRPNPQIAQRSSGPQPTPHCPCALCVPGFNAERTEDLSVLRPFFDHGGHGDAAPRKNVRPVRRSSVLVVRIARRREKTVLGPVKSVQSVDSVYTASSASKVRILACRRSCVPAPIFSTSSLSKPSASIVCSAGVSICSASLNRTLFSLEMWAPSRAA